MDPIENFVMPAIAVAILAMAIGAVVHYSGLASSVETPEVAAVVQLPPVHVIAKRVSADAAIACAAPSNPQSGTKANAS